MTHFSDHDVQACRDQYIAHLRDYADGCVQVRDEFLKAGFTMDQAFQLTMQYLDHVVCHATT